MNCPVCSTAVEDNAAMCHHCQSDLEIFQLIVKANEQRQTGRKLISALGVFAAVTAIGWASVGIFSGKRSDSATAELSPEVTLQGQARSAADSEIIAMITIENTSLRSENATLSAKLASANSKPAVKVIKAIKVEKTVKAEKGSISKASVASEGGGIIHTVRKGDTFWIISRKYFGSGTHYKQIAKDNGLTVKTKLHKGMKLKIQK